MHVSDPQPPRKDEISISDEGRRAPTLVLVLTLMAGVVFVVAWFALLAWLAVVLRASDLVCEGGRLVMWNWGLWSMSARSVSGIGC